MSSCSNELRSSTFGIDSGFGRCIFHDSARVERVSPTANRASESDNATRRTPPPATVPDVVTRRRSPDARRSPEFESRENDRTRLEAEDVEDADERRLCGHAAAGDERPAEAGRRGRHGPAGVVAAEREVDAAAKRGDRSKRGADDTRTAGGKGGGGITRYGTTS